MEESGTKPPIQPTVDAITPNRATAQKSADPTQRPPIPPDVPPLPEHETETCHCRPDQTPIAKIALEVFGAAVICAYTVAAYWQLSVVSSQLDKMQLGVEQTERAVILNRGQLAVANRNSKSAEDAAGTAQSTLENSQAQFREEQRPYISAEPRGGFSPTANTFLIFAPRRQVADALPGTSPYLMAMTVELKNVGKSPAIDVLVTNSIYKFGPVEQARDDARHFIPDFNNSAPLIIMAGSGVAPGSKQEPISTDQHDHIFDNSWDVYVVGAVRYRDVFHPTIAPYETTYCFRVKTAGLAFEDCKFRGLGNFTNSIK